MSVQAASIGTILVVDDTHATLSVLRTALEGAGYRVSAATNGERALQRLDVVAPDLVLLDVLMPGMDGYETCRRLKARTSADPVPVIFLSALSETFDKVRAFQVGAVDYVTKPVEPEELLARVRTHLALARLERQLQATNRSLEARVASRTEELRQANNALRAEIAERERVQAEREALLNSERAARLEAEQAGRMKDEFLATLSHEVRTPLNAILGWAEALLRAKHRSPESIGRGLDAIVRNARVQAKLVDDLLDMSRIVSGRVELDVQRVELVAALEVAVESLRPAAEAKGLRLVRRFDPETGTVVGDPVRLQQVIWNLLSNSIKFTPAGGEVSIGTRRHESHVDLEVCDTGMGIGSEFLPHVFERFRQADSSTTRRHGGLGLGLAIVRHLVETHGGTIQVRSEGENRGTCFTVSLPLELRSPVPCERPVPGPEESFVARPDDHPDLSGVRVLVVDDELDALELLREVLVDCDAEVEAASSASEALALFERRAPNVLVSDIAMPGEDGYTLIRWVRTLPPERGGTVPALAVTALARKADRAHALREGFQEHYAKPIEPWEVAAGIAALVRGEVPDSGGPLHRRANGRPVEGEGWSGGAEEGR